MSKIHTLAFAMAASAVVLTGCQYPNGQPNNTATGALVGGGIGALSGAALGGRNGAAGALVGGIFGAVAGSIVGNQMDMQQSEYLREQVPATYVRIQQGQPLTTDDVKALVRAKVSDDLIIVQIQNSRTVYHLSSGDIIDLHNAGVSDRVIDFMINTASAPAPAPTVESGNAPPPPQPDVYVAAPGPGYVWVAGDWQWNGVAWVWFGGHWATPPWPSAVWVHGYWYRSYWGHWRHVSGHWR